MDKTTSKIGSLSSNLATFLYMIHDKGIKIQDETISAICNKIDRESQKPAISQLAQLISEVLPQNISIEKTRIENFLRENNPADRFQQVDIFDLAKELISAIENTLSPQASFKETLSWLQERVPQIQDRFSGETREERIQVIRQYEFQHSLPWLARIANRGETSLEEQWVMVEKVLDTVHCMDPNPWDDIEEDTAYALPDFMTRWELCNNEAIFLG